MVCVFVFNFVSYFAIMLCGYLCFIIGSICGGLSFVAFCFVILLVLGLS